MVLRQLPPDAAPGRGARADLGTALPKAFDAFHADTARRTCKRCGTLHPGK